ncbi:MAG: tetratricopeptide repeat protein, partial [Aestuariivirgaceae bacterium]
KYPLRAMLAGALIAVALMLTFAYIAADNLIINPDVNEVAGRTSIAVLPFVDMSVNKDQDHFSEGLLENILTQLVKHPQFRAASRSSVAAYKDEKIDIPDVAKKLNVTHIVEGSVKKSGNELRITVQLIDAISDSHLWSETYDRKLDDVFAIQDEIATEVINQLRRRLLTAALTIKDTHPEAFVLSLQARHLRRQGTAEAYEQAIELFQQALAIAPDHAVIWNGLAQIYALQTSHGLRPFDEGHTLAGAAAEQALFHSPDHAPSHAQLGRIAMSTNDHLAISAQHFERALALEPANVDVLHDASILAVNLGRLDQAIAMNKYLAIKDAVNADVHDSLGFVMARNRRLDEAIVSY